MGFYDYFCGRKRNAHHPMAGLYVHIPFCESRCVYCGFFSTTERNLRERYVDALCRELELRRAECAAGWRTVYVGGGTPSQLPPSLLGRLFSAIDTSQAVEVTMECNPDDLSADFCEALAQLPVNRVSMGAQTFSEERLRFLRRRHKADDVRTAVERLRRVGIDNVSVDLMYGFPSETMDDWRHDIRCALALGVGHISAYCLTVEDGTPLRRMQLEGRVGEQDEETARAMYYELIDNLARAGYEHYEISNFAIPGLRSRHNSSYWDGTPYMGIGAAAHSYDGRTRSWNVADLRAYIYDIEAGRLPSEREVLSPDERYDDAVMLRLRTSQGISLAQVEAGFGRAAADYLLRNARKHVCAGLLERTADGHLRLTREGLFVGDMVTADLMRA